MARVVAVLVEAVTMLVVGSNDHHGACLAVQSEKASMSVIMIIGVMMAMVVVMIV